MKATILMEIPTQDVEERFSQLADAGENLVLMTGYSNYEDYYNDETTTDLMEYIKGPSYNVVIETSNYYVITPSLDFGTNNTGSRTLASI